ncbi:MAG: hypothetical protein JNN08_11015 [Bryobacterales bacterium]|nr:hypothetical protein [Bryobacterales bacterium]
MDRRIEELLEDHLRGSLAPAREAAFADALAAADAETRRMIQAFEQHAQLLRSLRAPDDAAPAPGFYARVLNRIEEQRVPSVWDSFVEPHFFKRLAFAALTLLMLLSVTVWTTPEPNETYAAVPVVEMASEPEPIHTMDASNRESNRDVILVNLATYQE